MQIRCVASVVLLAAALVMPAAVAAQSHTTAEPVIVAQGDNVQRVAPDQAWATVAVETRDARAPEARRLSAVAMTSVMAALKSSGLPADAIRTTGYSLTPDYEYVNGRQRMRGFLVTNQVRVRIDDIDKVADVLDAVGGLSLAASSNMNVTNLRFDVKDRAAVEREALRLAVESALANARAMAAGAGVTLGRIARIDQTGRAMPIDELRPMMAMATRDGAAVETPISPSEIEVRAGVMLTVEIR